MESLLFRTAVCGFAAIGVSASSFWTFDAVYKASKANRPAVVVTMIQRPVPGLRTQRMSGVGVRDGIRGVRALPDLEQIGLEFAKGEAFAPFSEGAVCVFKSRRVYDTEGPPLSRMVVCRGDDGGLQVVSVDRETDYGTSVRDDPSY